MRLFAARVCFLAFAGLAFLPTGALADYDISGRWGYHYSDSAIIHQWDIVQTRADLEVSDVGAPGIYMSGPMTGTIDLGTGEMVLDAAPLLPPSGCGASSLSGFASPDGESFTLTYTTHAYATHPPIVCTETTHTVIGSRCGNGIVDPGESCDDGNIWVGDCCSFDCTLEPAGRNCTDDDNVCTDDECDAGGTCTHAFNTAPCGDSCESANCANGACVASSFEPAGTSCDRDDNSCTVDTCDGAGACAAGSTIDCAPCGYCDTNRGCVLDTTECDGGWTLFRLSVGDHPRLNLEFHANASTDELGDPTKDTAYTLCLGQTEANPSDYRTPLFYEGTVAPSGMCDGNPCWTLKSERFFYKDKAGSAAGITAMKVNPEQGSFEWRGKGANLGMPADFINTMVSITPKLVIDDGLTSRCWARKATITDRHDTKVKGRG